MTDYVMILDDTNQHKGVDKNNTKTMYFMIFLKDEMVGVTGIEPVTPTMST